MRRLYEPEAFHTENYKKFLNNVCTTFTPTHTPIQFTGWGSLSVEISVITVRIR